jgi:hypothetical protein
MHHVAGLVPDRSSALNDKIIVDTVVEAIDATILHDYTSPNRRPVPRGLLHDLHNAPKLARPSATNDDMSDEPKRRRRPWIGWALIGLLVLYPLSFGPAIRFRGSNPLSFETMVTIVFGL